MILDKEIKNMPVPNELRFHQGRLVGILAMCKLEYRGVIFTAEAEHQFPEGDQPFAEDVAGPKQGEYIKKALSETQVQLLALEKIIDYKRQQ